MAARTFDYDPPQRFVAGTVGEPGSRTFFLQAGGQPTGETRPVTTSVVLEKQQVAALAERVDELLDEVLRRYGGAVVPAIAPAELEDLAPLDLPIEEEFRVGTMSLVWDEERSQVVIECFEALDSDSEDGEDSDDEDDVPSGTGGDRQLLRVSLSAGAARAFAKRAVALVAAGRPPCPFCTEPLDPQGHICPRANGYRR